MVLNLVSKRVLISTKKMTRVVLFCALSPLLSLSLPTSVDLTQVSDASFGVTSSLSTAHAQKRNKKRGKKKRGKKTRQLANSLDRKMINSPYGLIGIRAHMNTMNVSPTKTSDPFIKDPSRGVGFGFGLTIDKALNRVFGVRADVLYQNKNFSAQGKTNFDLTQNTTRETSLYLDYIEVPLMMVVRFMDGQLIRPYALFGGYGAALLTADGEQEEEGALDEPRRPFSTFDAGLVFGVGSYFVLAPGAGFLSAELRYTQGMVNIADTDVEAKNEEKAQSANLNKTPLSRQTYNTSNFMIMVGYYF